MSGVVAWALQRRLSGSTTRLLATWAAFSFFMLGVLPALCLDDASFRISGVAVSEQGDAPIAGCHITAMRSGQPNRGRVSRQLRQPDDASTPSTDTDSRGHFVLNLPSAGSWQIYGFARGFRRQAFDRHEDFFSSVVLTAAAPTYDMKFVLEPDSTISGFVQDEAGEGVRNARVTLLGAESLNPDLAAAGSPVRSSTVTDDRGHYEFAELAPGNYVVEVQAEPWYAAGAAGRRITESGSDAAVDPLLDVVYGQVYFPGVSDRRSAEVLSLHHGESREADFHLNPTPATHLRITPPSSTGDASQRGQFFPQVERVSNEGNPFVNTSVQIDGRGQIDVGGLSPGLYRVTLRGPGGQQTPSFIRVPGGSNRSIDLASATPVCELLLHLETSDADAGRIQIIFRDTDSGATFTSYGQGGGLQRRQGGAADGQTASDRRLEVPPGQYQITLAGANDTYLAGLTTKGATVTGRAITVGSGSTALTLKIAQGRAVVQGVVSAGDGAPVRGAMVMLVPATFGQVGSIPVLRRDQTNTDGGFSVGNVIPGNYILLAIDGGWTVNWRDPSTLAGYLIHGVPLTLDGGKSTQQDLKAQRP